MIYLQLFYVYLKIGFFGFGGGYAMLSLIQNEIVVRNGWLTNAELADIIAISQMTPGPIAINSATYIGYTVTGNIWGSMLATVAVCLPSLTIMLAVTRFYLKLRNNRYVTGAMAGMQPMVIGMIVAAALILLTPDTFIDWKSWVIFGLCFVLSVRKVNPILLIVASGVAGVVLYY
ncbi:chromate transporter [Gallalistipes aquisgranensis]|uniref:chromate transporter n=1 Tax=Gallalistipes aquisgranensis TaxID=2779358 RepID=UPI001CF7F11D|nr:chromate transporter [Gallalistipes aquisgranensis]MBE5033772.1 chromate transporter [Gallalistipes aquisgranensis]